MTSTDRLQGIVTQIRSTLARRTDRGGTAGRSQAANFSLGTQGRLTLEELRAGLRSGLAGLDLEQSGDRKRARRLFIESVLLSEFGINLANDARFIEVVSGVESVFSEEPAFLEELDSVLADASR